MSSSLSSTDLARLEAATRTLVSPLAMPDPNAWRQEAMRTLCDLLGTERAAFYHPDCPELVAVFGSNDRYAERLHTYTAETWTGTGTSLDPILDEFHAKLLRRRVGVWNMESADYALLGRQGRAWNNLFYHEVLAGERAGDTHALFVPTERGSVMLAVHDFRRPPSSDEHFPLLRVLRPALLAGLDTLERLGAYRAALDATGEPLAGFDADGTETYRSGSLARLLAEDPEVALVEAALGRFVGHVRTLCFPRREGQPEPHTATDAVQTARARYTFRAALLHPGALGHADAFLVSVTTDGGAPALPTPAEVRERYGLSKRETEVALLVAQGLPNSAIAERLFVSSHTVRHHVENAMAKMGLTGRGRETLAARLLGATALA